VPNRKARWLAEIEVVVPPIFSKKFLDEFTRGHPFWSWLVILFGFWMLGFIIWLITSS